MNRLRKLIASADQLVDGKKYWLQSEFSLTRYECRFWEVDEHTAWFTTYAPHARFIGLTELLRNNGDIPF